MKATNILLFLFAPYSLSLAMIDLKQNFFELFQLPIAFSVDSQTLSVKFRELQAQVHPDKFANASEQDSRLALQMTAHVNEAYETLSNPRLRAYYLLKLEGLDFDDEREVAHDPVYLMEQLEIRESIENVKDSVDPFEEIDQITRLVKDRRQDIENTFVSDFDNGDYEKAKQSAVKMRFCERVLAEIKQVEESLDELF